jgi:CheY-like chemotaxis protein
MREYQRLSVARGKTSCRLENIFEPKRSETEQPGLDKSPEYLTRLSGSSDLVRYRPTLSIVFWRTNMTRILIADANPALRSHVSDLCRQHHDVVIAAEASTPVDMLERASVAVPDVVVASLTGTTRGLFEAVRELKRRYPATPVIVLSLYHHDEYAMQALDAGASGFLMMEHAREQLIETVRMLALGRSVYSHEQFASI